MFHASRLIPKFVVRKKEYKMDEIKKYNYNYIFFKTTTKIGLYSSEEIDTEEIITDIQDEKIKKSFSIFLKTKLLEKSIVMHGTLEIIQDNLSSQIPFAVFVIMIKSDIIQATETSKELTINYILCLSLEVKSWNLLGLFISDLSLYCKSFREAFVNNEPNQALQKRLSTWSHLCVDYISRFVDYCGDNLASILYFILKGRKFKIQGTDEEKQDFGRFVSNLVVVNILNKSIKQKKIIFEDKKIKIEKKTNAFCEQWAQKIHEIKDNDPYRIQQLIKDTLGEISNQLTSFKNMVNDSVLDNYILYQSYLFLNSHSNSNVLLSILKSSTNKKQVLEVIQSLKEFLHSEEELEK
eukprot:TRINITY_DN4870_c0_g1_i1.p1 TRINITY_DN4870_c0_g1~~TRINITY_DN4870_c0_g1_i1.p1  ORF type:complete len:352 (+),score=98.43 TRINITY_DN4870_c0_g1_i1:1-1056(+)